MKKRDRASNGRFAVCIDEGSYAGELQRLKVYEVLPDPDAERHDQIRVIDESGEDYLYPKSFFFEIELPHTIDAAILRAC